jgi:hypothetical protein
MQIQLFVSAPVLFIIITFKFVYSSFPFFQHGLLFISFFFFLFYGFIVVFTYFFSFCRYVTGEQKAKEAYRDMIWFYVSKTAQPSCISTKVLHDDSCFSLFVQKNCFVHSLDKNHISLNANRQDTRFYKTFLWYLLWGLVPEQKVR